MRESTIFMVILCLAAVAAFIGHSWHHRRGQAPVGQPLPDRAGAQEATARATAAAAAVRAMDQLRSELERADIEIVKAATIGWIGFYRRKLVGKPVRRAERSQGGELGRALRAVAVEAERYTIEDLLAIDAIPPELARKLIGEIDDDRRRGRMRP